MTIRIYCFCYGFKYFKRRIKYDKFITNIKIINIKKSTSFFNVKNKFIWNRFIYIKLNL